MSYYERKVLKINNAVYSPKKTVFLKLGFTQT